MPAEMCCVVEPYRASDLYHDHRLLEAAAQYERTSVCDPSWAAPQLGLGNVQRELGNQFAAIEAYAKAVELSPRWSEAHIALADMLLAIGRSSDAERRLRDAIVQLPLDSRLHSMLGLALFREGRRHDSLAEFERSIQLCARCMADEEAKVYKLLRNVPN